MEALSKRKLPPVEYLNNLHQQPLSSQFAEDLARFSSPKSHQWDVFKEGVLLFSTIANLSPTEREDYYGNCFLGVHYDNDLARLWNTRSEEPIKPQQIRLLCPPVWHYEQRLFLSTLFYCGNNPSLALDQLLQGPTVIDCGIFCQLAVWFGLKYMLGDAVFNQVFSRAPLYLTQVLYQAIGSPREAHKGNPLYAFFQSAHAELETSKRLLALEHIPNHKLYTFKHPGGNYGGDNCIAFGNEYIIFDPTLELTAFLSRGDIERLLLRQLNAKQDAHDEQRLASYKKQKPDAFHSRFRANYADLIQAADSLSHFEADKIECNPLYPAKKIYFNFDFFLSWLEKIQHQDLIASAYVPLKNDQLAVSQDLLTHIPYKDKVKMSFEKVTFKSVSEKKMRLLAEKFCSDVLSGQSVLIALTGEARVAQVVSLVSAAKELSSRGKNLVWVSKNLVNSWTNNAKSIDVNVLCDAIQAFLTLDHDAVFLDLDHFEGGMREVLLQEMYNDYAGSPGQGLFVISSKPISLRGCFVDYTSPQYINTTCFP